MRILLLLVTALAILTGLTGCSSGKTHGLASPGMTKEDVNRRHLDVIQNDIWQIQDDIDAFFLLDRAGRRNQLILR
jgi:hypothetical protein